MHGEYKVPGGKLVVVDLEVEDGRLKDVRVAGDFFLEPDEALLAINRALEGAPADTDARGLAGRVEAALPEGAVMFGFTADAVGVAVRRALAHATDWTDYDWQLIHEGPQPPALHMALDEVLTEEVALGRRPPTLRVWECVPESLVSGLSFADSYAYLDDWVLGALGDMGIAAWYQPLNDIATDAGKIGGAAQKRVVTGSGAVLHHVTMSYDIDADKMVEVLRIGREKLSDKGTRSAKKRVDPLRRQTGLARAAVIDRMIASFRERYGLADGKVTEEEAARAQRLAEAKFGSWEWTTRVP
ncbi:lipoate--protein ligase family protein [Streptomyces sp. MCAF7]